LAVHHALTHDDRLDAVAGAVGHFQRVMMMRVDQAGKATKDAAIAARSRTSPKGFNQPTYRGMRVNQWGPGGYVVEPARLERNVEPS
jgi:hypothetical protein